MRSECFFSISLLLHLLIKVISPIRNGGRCQRVCTCDDASNRREF